tara:strand:- start:2486 stop:4519 length:2034 start_codon:yes stop_codon:yes gene_type:complete
MAKIANITKQLVHLDFNGITFFNSGAGYYDVMSQSAQGAEYALTCSADVGNSLAKTSSLSGYVIVPLVSGGAVQFEPGLPTTNLNLIYATGSHHEISASFTESYYRPDFGVSGTDDNYNLIVVIEKNETANNVALKTWRRIQSASLQNRLVSSALSASIITFNLQQKGEISSSIDVTKASGFNYNYIQSGSYGSGSIQNYLSPSGFLHDHSSSFIISRDVSDHNSILFKVTGSAPGNDTNEDIDAYYISSSGQLGINTKSPTNKFDIKADTFKIRSADGKKEIEFDEDGILKTRKFAGAVGAETTGSEVMLSYSPGTFEIPSKAVVGDIMGTIRWQDESFASSGSRSSGTPVSIQGKIVASSIAGVAGHLIHNVANPSSLASGPTEVLRIGYNNTHITGALNVSTSVTATQITSSVITVKGEQSTLELRNATTINTTAAQNLAIVQGAASNIDIGAYELRAQTLESDVATGTAPLTITSTTEVANLHVATSTTASFATNFTASGNISASGTIQAPSFVGTPVILEQFSIYATNVNGSTPEYRAGSTAGTEAGNWAANISSRTTPAAVEALYGMLLPFKMRNISLKATARSQGGGAPSLWMYTGSRPNGTSAYDLGFAASASCGVVGSGTGAYNIDITGSAAFNTRAEDDTLFLYLGNDTAATDTMRVTVIIYGERDE